MNKFLTLIFLCIVTFAQAQKPKTLEPGEIYHKLEKLNFLGSALYIAAHPDDENTRLISYLSNEVKARTAYLSLTRGDGGQNLIGTEIQELLGILRTQELLQARNTDGGQQFFSRAIDFGYSKHPDETLAIWNKDEVLSDVVRIIRQFKPDIIVNRFDHRSPGRTHGHHTSSAMLSLEAFDLVGDKSSYPDQLKTLDTWQPTRLFFNTSWWFYGSREKFAEADKTNLMSIDIGTYYPLLGKSNTEIAAEARSMHRCQGFGSMGSRGSYTEYLELLAGEMPDEKTNPFQGINTTWTRVTGGEEVDRLMRQVLNEYDFKAPHKSVSTLIKVYSAIQKTGDEHWKEIKTKEVEDIIHSCMGLYLEASADVHRATPMDSVEVKIEAINRSPVAATLSSYQIQELNLVTTPLYALENNTSYENYERIQIGANQGITSAYWLRDEGTLGMFDVKDASKIGMPESPRAYTVVFDIEIEGEVLSFERNLVYKYTDPGIGEMYRPFEITEPVFVSIEEDVIIFPNDESKKIEVSVESGKSNVNGSLTLNAPKGWTVSPSSIPFDIANKGGISKFVFDVTPPSTQSTGYIKPEARVDGQSYKNDLIEIDYDHIPLQTILRPERAKISKLEIHTKGDKVAYIMGAGDKVPDCLRYIGYQVDEIEIEDSEPEILANYDAVVLGIRALNTIENIDVYRDNLLGYVESGGTMIVQYNTSRRLKSKNFGPHPMSLGRFRVSQEDAEIRIVNPDHPVLNSPNKITQTDFEDWIQERGLYFASEWDPQYETIFSANDKGEEPGEGGMLITKHGEGYFVYSSFSWFRQLPAGVPGAYRIFANMIALGK